ncbi:MAG: hypothetical protein M3Q08_10195 [Pseudomonadota bacterium]|nr:hypothetical protein [Pseudomonadota bacterium]
MVALTDLSQRKQEGLIGPNYLKQVEVVCRSNRNPRLRERVHFGDDDGADAASQSGKIMQHSRNEVEPSDNTDYGAKPPMGATIALLSALHVLCCGLPLLLLSGVSLATIFPSWPVIGAILAVLGVVGFVWYLRKGCATCPGNPKRCRVHPSRQSKHSVGEN